METSSPQEYAAVSPPPQPHQQAPSPSSPPQSRPTPSPQQQQQSQPQPHARMSPSELASQAPSAMASPAAVAAAAAAATDDAAVSDELDMFDMVLQREFFGRSAYPAHSTGAAAAPLSSASPRHPTGCTRQASAGTVTAAAGTGVFPGGGGAAGGGSGGRAAAAAAAANTGVTTPPSAQAFRSMRLTSLATSLEATSGAGAAAAAEVGGAAVGGGGFMLSSSPTMALLGDEDQVRRVARRMAETVRQELNIRPPPSGETGCDDDLRLLSNVFTELFSYARPNTGTVHSAATAAGARRVGGTSAAAAAAVPYPASHYMGSEHAYHHGGSGSRGTASQPQSASAALAGGHGVGTGPSNSRRRPSPNALTAGGGGAGGAGGVRRGGDREAAYNNGRSTIDVEVTVSLDSRSRSQAFGTAGAGALSPDLELLRAQNVNPCPQPMRQPQQPLQGYGIPRTQNSAARRIAKTGATTAAAGLDAAATAITASRSGASPTAQFYNPVAVKPTPGAAPAGTSGKSAGRSRGPRSESGKNIAPSNHSAFSECSGGETRSFQSNKTNQPNNTSSSVIATTNTSLSSTIYHNSATRLTSVAGLNGSASVMGSEGVTL